ncbi:MAG: TIGR04552 family protein [Holophagaceae bacterium]|nr:TIGR04552 family protein [Holophagaceae bacterium]
MARVSFFPLPPEATRVILGGESSIDMAGLNLPDHRSARGFARNYGYDLDNPAQRAHVVQVYGNAMEFLGGTILEGELAAIPLEIRELRDPEDLLVWASRRPQDPLSHWACVVLRVMHTLFHIDHNVNLRNLKDIQAQVFEPYDRFLVALDDGTWALRGDYEVPLVAAERKQNKDRTSMLLKMLHKPENVAETIYDQIGMRFVAQDRLGVLLVIRFLLDHHVIMPTHIKPSRSRNLLVDMEALQAWTAGLPEGYAIPAVGSPERDAICARLTPQTRAEGGNPFTSRDYKAVQITVRTLIRLPNPAVAVLEKISKSLAPGDATRVKIPQLIQEQEEFTFFFAHEVQVMEPSGFQSARSGPASHGEYKQRQRDAVRKRVLRGIKLEEAPC